MYVLCSANDLIKPQHIQQRGLGNIRSELRRRAPTVSPRFIYIQQYTGPQPTPKHTYTNHSRHAKLNLTQRASVCIYACVCVCVCEWAEEKASFPERHVIFAQRGEQGVSEAFGEMIQWYCWSKSVRRCYFSQSFFFPTY